jgi:PAS domain S-box-containing protein
MTGRIDYHSVFRTSPNPYMVVDRSLRFVDANEAYLEATHSTLEGIRGRSLFEAFPGGDTGGEPAHVRQLRHSLERVIRTGLPDVIALIQYPMARQTSDGITYVDRYWSATHTPLFDESGEVTHVLQHTVDVTELQDLKRALRRAEAVIADETGSPRIEEGVFSRARKIQEAHTSLAQEHERLRRLIDEAPTFTAIVRGREHIFEFANQAYYRLIGNRDILGKPAREAIPEVSGQGFLELLDHVAVSREPVVRRGMKIVLSRPGAEKGVDTFVDFLYQPVFEEDGMLAGIFIQGHDVTEQHRAQRDLERLNSTLERRVAERTHEVESRNRELQEFAFIASHDLQEPLRKVHSFAALLLEEYGQTVDDQGRWYFERIQSSIKRMSLLIKDLLAYSRISSGERDAGPVDLNEVIGDVTADLQIQVEECDGCVEVEPMPTVIGDDVQLRQLFQNLVSNALKFHRETVNPDVKITHAPSPESELFVEIHVADNGIGVSAEHAERIFLPFQRLHSRRTYEGTGIGLAVCRRIVERHNGSIRVESNDQQGATFVVTLPRADGGDHSSATSNLTRTHSDL